jgi:hypothetical protein
MNERRRWRRFGNRKTDLILLAPVLAVMALFAYFKMRGQPPLYWWSEYRFTRKIESEDVETRRRAAEGLGHSPWYGSLQAVRALVPAATGDPDEIVRWHAVRSLGGLRDVAVSDT